MSPTVVKSSLCEALYEGMRGLLFPVQDFFIRPIVAVPSFLMKQWLQRRLAKDEGIFFGVQIVTLEDLMRRLYNPLMPSHYDLSLAIECCLEEMDDEELIEMKSPKRLSALSSHLATLFIKYGLQERVDWGKGGWQKDLWNRLHQPPYRFDTWADVLKDRGYKASGPVHLFGFSSIPPLFLQHLPKDSYLWMLSPSSSFWSDLTYEKGKIGPKELLARWGASSKKCTAWMEDHGWEYDGVYPPIGNRSLLNALQSQIVHLDEGALPPPDSSLEIYVARTRGAEVDLLYDRLIEENVDPSDVLILSPNIGDYLPYIRARFDKEDCPFPIALCDVKKGDGNVYWELLQELIALSSCRFEREKVIHLFTHQSFRKALGLDEEQVDILTEWFRSASIYWGWDKEMRNTIVPGYEEGNRGTWEGGFEELLDHWIEGGDENLVATSEVELLGIGIESLRKLKYALAPFNDHVKRSLEEWRKALINLFENFVAPLEDEEGHESLLLAFDALLTPFTALHGAAFSFPTIWNRLKSVMEEKRGLIGENWLHALTFASMRSARGVPKKWIYLLGMGEEFPKRGENDPLSIIGNALETKEEDRQLFLDILLSGRDKLTISYSSHELLGPEHGECSTLLTELFETTQCSVIKERKKLGQNEVCPSIQWSPPKSADVVKQIDINDLIRFAKDPLKSFFNSYLKIHLKREEAIEESSHEPFSLNALDRYKVRQGCLDKKERINMPLGNYLELAKEDIADIENDYKLALSQFGIDETPFAIEWAHGVKEGAFPRFPPIVLDINGEEVELVGRLEGVTKCGVIAQEVGDEADHVRNWPKLLLINLLEKEGITPSILYPRSKTSVSYSIGPDALKDFVHLYLMGQKSPSLALPDWVPALIKKSAEEAKSTLEKSDSFNRRSPYTDYLLSHAPNIDLNTIEEWQNLLGRVYGSIKSGI